MSSASPSNPSPVPRPTDHPWRRALTLAGIFIAAFIVLSVATGALHRPPPHEENGWLTNYEAALSRAASEGKPILADFYFIGCPPCDAMSREVFPQPEVSRTLHEQFVPVKVDVRDGGAGSDLAVKYWIDATPTMLVIDPAGNLIARHTGYMDADQVMVFLRAANAKVAAIPSAASRRPDTQPAH